MSLIVMGLIPFNEKRLNLVSSCGILDETAKEDDDDAVRRMGVPKR
jgi:hypothetical protein